jgi:hypothetical protein
MDKTLIDKRGFANQFHNKNVQTSSITFSKALFSSEVKLKLLPLGILLVEITFLKSEGETIRTKLIVKEKPECMLKTTTPSTIKDML